MSSPLALDVRSLWPPRWLPMRVLQLGPMRCSSRRVLGGSSPPSPATTP